MVTDVIYQQFLKRVAEKFKPEECLIVQKAFDYAQKAHDGQKRLSGEPYFNHCVITADTLLDQIPDPYIVCGGLLHDVLEDTSITIEKLKKDFPEPIADLVEGVTKISGLKFQSAREKQMESFRKMFLAMAKDIRVILIKMADRLHNMRTIRFLPPERQNETAKETLEIYAPLAHRLGMAKIKAEFEDSAMAIIYPKEYNEIVRELEKKKNYWERLINEIKNTLGTILKEHNIPFEIQGRIKHIFSIYRKMMKQRLKLSEVYDLLAIRIITDTEVNCYEIFGLVHSKWRPIPHRIKDFIAVPKENLYRSLHTTVILRTRDRVEIQIRTKMMQEIAEDGIAAHWKYKEGISGGKVDVEEKLNWLRRLREWLLSYTHPSTDLLETLQQDVFADVVFCFTPKGDIVELPKGATPVDFAFSIHSEIGEHCEGSRVNDRLVPLRYILNNGDIVEIITAKNAHPTASWLEFVKTGRARNKIRHFLRAKFFDENVNKGKDILMHAIKGKNISISQTQLQNILRDHLRALKINSYEELLAELGFGGINIQQVLNRIIIELQKQGKKTMPPQTQQEAAIPEYQKPKTALKVSAESTKKKASEILIDGMSNAEIRMAKCCNPTKGISIIGYVTRGRGVTIHRKDCASLNRIIGDNVFEDARLVRAEWNEGFREDFKRASIRIVCYDRIGLLSDVTGIINSHRLKIVDADTKVNVKKSIATLRFQLLTDNLDNISNLLEDIRMYVKGVIKAESLHRGKNTLSEEKTD